jgi:hypothetical protein
MWKTLISIAVILGTSSVANAQTITDPNEIAAKLHFWAKESGEPVYYGAVNTVSAKTKQVGDFYQCLALAFIDFQNGVFTYGHKMWDKSPDGSCHYEDVTSKKVGNHGICVKDSEAGFGTAVGTARMSKDNIDWQNSVFRAVDTNTRQVGETAKCIPPRGGLSGLYSLKIEDGRFKLITTRPLDYEVSIEPQDPKNPPTKPVF